MASTVHRTNDEKGLLHGTHLVDGDRGVVQYKEGDGSWIDVPAWAQFLIELGYYWSGEHARRRIALISLPCQSTGAGLIALGLLRNRMERPGADDLSRHFNRISELASDGDRRLRLVHRSRPRQRYVPWHVDADGVWVRQINVDNPVSRTIAASTAAEWHFEAEPQMQLAAGAVISHRQIYDAMIPGQAVCLTENLSRSDSAICLATEVLGEAAAQEKYTSTFFGDERHSVSLAELLTVHAWSSTVTSRVLLWNARLNRMDRAGTPHVVVADGHACFQRIINREEFQSADIVCVFHRLIDRTALEELGAKIGDLRQWYEDVPMAAETLPNGISMLTLARL